MNTNPAVAQAVACLEEQHRKAAQHTSASIEDIEAACEAISDETILPWCDIIVKAMAIGAMPKPEMLSSFLEEVREILKHRPIYVEALSALKQLNKYTQVNS